jgi:hypothetical protein
VLSQRYDSAKLAIQKDMRDSAMKKDLTIFMLAWALGISVQALAQKQTPVEDPFPPPSAFLPPVGQIVHYRFTDTLTTPKESKSETGTLTLTAVTAHEIKATVALDNKAPRNFALHVDQTGALQPSPGLDPPSPSSTPRRNGQSTPSTAEQAFLLRLSVASQIGAHPGEDVSIPVLLNVPWASGPVNPTLYVKSTAPDAFTGDASDTTTINPPQNARPHILRSVAISTGVGIAAGEIGGTTGRIIRPLVTVSSILIATRSHSGPQPTDVTLHITGQLSRGRLQTLSGKQEYTVAAKEHSRVFSDQWQLVAQ